MEEIFRSYWWLLFPLSWFVIGGWNSWLNYRRSKDAMDLMRQYAAQGKEPPPDLMRTLSYPVDDDGWGGRRRWRRGYYGYGSYGYRRNWPARVVTLGVLSAGFAWAAWSDYFGVSQPFAIVAFILGAIALATLVGGLFSNFTGQDHDEPRDRDPRDPPRP